MSTGILKSKVRQCTQEVRVLPGDRQELLVMELEQLLRKYGLTNTADIVRTLTPERVDSELGDIFGNPLLVRAVRAAAFSYLGL